MSASALTFPVEPEHGIAEVGPHMRSVACACGWVLQYDPSEGGYWARGHAGEDVFCLGPESVYTAPAQDAPGDDDEAEEPLDDLDTRYRPALPVLTRPVVTDDRAMKDARNAALRAGRLHKQQLRRQAGERIRGPRPRGA